MAISEGSSTPQEFPERRRTILITQEVDASRCYGDTVSGVRPSPPLSPEDFNGMEIPQAIREAFDQGHQVFVTESELYMFVRPE